MQPIDNDFLRAFSERRALLRSVSPASLVPVDLRWKHTVKDVKKGGVIRFDNTTCIVLGVSEYSETDESFRKKAGFSWFELTLRDLSSGKTLYLEWEEDDEVEVSITKATLAFRDILDDMGSDLDGDDFEDLIEEEDSITYRGSEFRYDDDYHALYKRGGTGRDQKGDKVSFCDFLSLSGDACVTIERWKDGKDHSFEIFLSHSLDPRRIEVISLGGS